MKIFSRPFSQIVTTDSVLLRIINKPALITDQIENALCISSRSDLTAFRFQSIKSLRKYTNGIRFLKKIIL